MSKSPSKAVSKKASVTDHADLHAAIQTAAYYRAEQRVFEPGHDQEDWFLAESGILENK